VDNCSGKFIVGNQKIMSTFVELQSAKQQQMLNEASNQMQQEQQHVTDAGAQLPQTTSDATDASSNSRT